MKEEGDSVPRNAETTHKIMSAIKSKDTEPELLVRKALWKDGYRYRINVRKLPGKPDIVFTKAKIAVFVMVISGMAIIGLCVDCLLWKRN